MTGQTKNLITNHESVVVDLYGRKIFDTEFYVSS